MEEEEKEEGEEMMDRQEEEGDALIYRVVPSRQYLRSCCGGCRRFAELSLLHFVLKFIGGYLLIAPRKRKICNESVPFSWLLTSQQNALYTKYPFTVFNSHGRKRPARWPHEMRDFSEESLKLCFKSTSLPNLYVENSTCFSIGCPLASKVSQN